MGIARVRTVDFLVANHRFVANAASLAFLSFVGALALIALIGGFGLDPNPDALLSRVIGVLLGGAMVPGLFAMVAASWKVLRRREGLIDWGLFLALVWLVPYIGIAVYLGGANLLHALRVKRACDAHKLR